MRIILVAIVLAAAGCDGSAAPGDAGALAKCQLTIKGFATDSQSAVVPYTKNQGTGGEFYFAWPKGSGLRLKNGFGATTDASAACIVAPDGSTITHLSIDGTSVI